MMAGRWVYTSITDREVEPLLLHRARKFVMQRNAIIQNSKTNIDNR